MSRNYLAVLVLLVGCHHDQAKTTTVSSQVPPPATAEHKAPTTDTASKPVSSNLSAGTDLVAACKLHFDNNGEAPKFDFDRFELTSQDRSVLDQVATCVTSGPLKGKGLHLVGRADPRGTEEYNLGLGDRRAHTVETYLQRLGVSQVATTTRGALDATGTDDSSWRTDRRVDLELAN